MPLTAARRALRRARYGEPVIVVSGLPRSGTSMAMQMLAAGGVEPVTDGLRTPDESNPQGYYELERVKDLEKTTDWAWLGDARGRAVKIITFLIPHLPETFNYKVIFMQRRLGEVLASQTKMLDSLGEANDAEDRRMRELYINHVARTKSLLAHRPCFEALHLQYEAVVADGKEHAERISRFLGRRLDTAAMAAVISPDLYRNRR